MDRISVAKEKNYYTFLCDSVSLDMRKNIATINGGEYDGVLVYGVDGVCIEHLIKEMRGRKVQLNGRAFYAEKDGKEIKLKDDPKYEQGSLL